jgi:hypothetical protein
MIPDKIYIHLTPHLGLLEATGIPVNAPDEQEYIRKDALMEKISNLYFSAYEKAKESGKDEDIATQNAFAVVIDEIKSM